MKNSDKCTTHTRMAGKRKPRSMFQAVLQDTLDHSVMIWQPSPKLRILVNYLHRAPEMTSCQALLPNKSTTSRPQIKVMQQFWDNQIRNCIRVRDNDKEHRWFKHCVGIIGEAGNTISETVVDLFLPLRKEKQHPYMQRLKSTEPLKCLRMNNLHWQTQWKQISLLW